MEKEEYMMVAAGVVNVVENMIHPYQYQVRRDVGRGGLYFREYAVELVGV